MKITTCPACKSSNIKPLETVQTIDIAKVFSRVDLKLSQIIMKYLEKGSMPATIYIDKCCVCGLEFANPPFAGDAEWYSVISYGMRWDFYQCLKDLPPKPASILDIGCSEGQFLELVASGGYQVLGLDFNEVALKICRDKGLEVMLWDIKKLDKFNLDRKFHAVVAFHVIENIDDPEALISNLSRMMPKGTKLYLSCPGPRRYTTYLEPVKRLGLRDMWDYPPDHQTRWNRVALEKILSRFGWSMRKYREEPFDWLGISGYFVSEHYARKGLKLSDLSWLERKIRIVNMMLRTFIPSLKYKGLGIYCVAIRQ